MFDNVIINVINSEEFKISLSKDIAEMYVQSKLYEQDFDKKFRSEINNSFQKECENISKEMVSKSIKRSLERDYEVRQIVVESMIPMIGKIIDEALQRKSK